MPPAFQYPPLDAESKEIRLAVLTAGEGDQDLFCRIHHYSLSECPPYEALSYVWGDQEHLHPLTVCPSGDDEERQLKITLNLQQALFNLRQMSRARPLWIDAICINQKDDEERSRQVSLMKEIYANAFHTVVYLGPESELSVKGVDFMKHICGTIDPSLLKRRELIAPPTDEDRTNHPIRVALDEYKALDCMVEFFTRPWWSRVWIVQELAVAPKAIFTWGSISLPWEFCARTVIMFDKYINFIRDFDEFEGSEELAKIDEGVLWGSPIIRIRQTFEHKAERPLFDLVERFWMSEATDPRDNIYALLGLATDGHPGEIVPSYSSSMGSVFGSVVKDLQTRCGNLDVLSLNSGPGARRVEGLPTWAPDWTRCGKKLKFEDGYHTFPIFKMESHTAFQTTKPRGSTLFCASGTPNDMSTVRFSADCLELYLTGVVIDRISTVSTIRTYLMSFSQIAREWGPLGDALGPIYPNGEEIADVFDRTLCMDQFPHTPNSAAMVAYTLARDPREYEMFISMSTSGRRFMATEQGLMGLAMYEAEVGDLICVLRGIRTPIILRHEGGHYLMVGETYVHGLMYSRHFESRVTNGIEETEFRIL